MCVLTRQDCLSPLNSADLAVFPIYRFYELAQGKKLKRLPWNSVLHTFSFQVAHLPTQDTYLDSLQKLSLFPFPGPSTRMVTTDHDEQKNGLSAPTVPNWGGQLPKTLMTRAGLHSFYNFEFIFGFTIE